MKEIKGMVSVLIPCYNHEKYIADCLNSILAQTYRQFEVIVCDDCSADQTVAVARKQKEQFDEKGIPFLLMESQKNQGITKNINRMLKEASGEFIKIIASDDMLTDTYLTEMVLLLEEDPSLNMIFSNGYRVMEQAVYPVEEKYILEPIMDTIPDCKNNMFERIYNLNFIPAPTLLIRRCVLTEVGGYDETIGIEDWEMLLRLLQKYPEGVGACERNLVYYRVNSNSISSTVSNPGAWKRIRFMHSNSAAIIKKYKNQVPRRVYHRRIWSLHKEYLIIRLIAFVKRLKV